jgi:nitronate monooxygenase/enoyl-[acyl-carrier protein] reductase II
MVRRETSRPFAVNHVVATVDEDTFVAGLAAGPKLVSMALADPGLYPKRAHDAGALFMQQVTTVADAAQAAERGADIIVAQGTEAGGYGGRVIASMVLIPQVVDAVAPIPVVAAGGIFDGRGLAAALALGAAGVNLGTRFLASLEAPSDSVHRRIIVEAGSQESVKVQSFDEAYEGHAPHYGTWLRAIKTPYVDDSGDRHDLAQGGQSAGGIKSILSASEVIASLVADAEEALRTASRTTS